MSQHLMNWQTAVPRLHPTDKQKGHLLPLPYFNYKPILITIKAR